MYIKKIANTEILNRLIRESLNSNLCEADNINSTEEPTDQVNDISNMSTKEVQDTLISQSEEASGGEQVLTKQSAAQASAEIANIKSDLKNDVTSVAVALTPENSKEEKIDYYTENVITKYLDRSARSRENLLIIGLPGFAKTATVWSWAKHNNINLVSWDVQTDDILAFISGLSFPDKDDKEGIEGSTAGVLKKFASKELRELFKPNTVLYLDEFNRTSNDTVRTSLMKIIQNRAVDQLGINGAPLKLPNLLFTVITINPPSAFDPSASALTAAERSRFTAPLIVEPDTNAIVKFYKNYVAAVARRNAYEYLKDISNTKPIDKIKGFCYAYDFIIFLLTYPSFKWDTLDDLNSHYINQGKRYLPALPINQRVITNLGDDLAASLAAAHGDIEASVDGLLDSIDAEVVFKKGYADDFTETIVECANKYLAVAPDMENLLKTYNLIGANKKLALPEPVLDVLLGRTTKTPVADSITDETEQATVDAQIANNLADTDANSDIFEDDDPTMWVDSNLATKSKFTGLSTAAAATIIGDSEQVTSILASSKKI